MSGDRLVKVRAKSLVVSTGTYEIPLLFENNDLPGIMLASGVRRLLHLWGVLPGTRAVIISANPRGLQTALDLRQAGIMVAAVAAVGSPPLFPGPLPTGGGKGDSVYNVLWRSLRDTGIEIIANARVMKAR